MNKKIKKSNGLRLFKSRKAATFDAYNWFVLIVTMFLLTAALISLYARTSNIPAGSIGVRASEMMNLHSKKEINLTVLDEAVKKAANEAVIELALTGGVTDDSSLIDLINVPLVMDSANSDPKNKYSKSLIESNFKEIFLRKLNENLVKVGFDYQYTTKSISIINGNTIVGFALNDVNLTKEIYSGSDLLFCTVSPTSAPTNKPSATPFIGNPNQSIIITNTFFNPMTVEVQVANYDVDTLGIALYGNQTKSIEDGIYTIYDTQNNIYKQYNLFEVRDEFNNLLFEVRQDRGDNIDFSKNFTNIVNG